MFSYSLLPSYTKDLCLYIFSATIAENLKCVIVCTHLFEIIHNFIHIPLIQNRRTIKDTNNDIEASLKKRKLCTQHSPIDGKRQKPLSASATLNLVILCN